MGQVEKRRGCGVRKPGGFYLVTGGKPFMCGRQMPSVPWHHNPHRGYQYIPLMDYLESWSGKPHACSKKDCEDCPIKRMKPFGQALMAWVGVKYYRTPKDFLEEGQAMGFSRRIPERMIGPVVRRKLPIILAHRHGIEWTEKVDRLPKEEEQAAVLEIEDQLQFHLSIEDPKDKSKEIVRYSEAKFIYAFYPKNVEYILKGDESDERIQELTELGVKLVDFDAGEGANRSLF